jgi:hypothetical protein
VAQPTSVDREAERALQEALADLATLVLPADLIHLRDTLKAARDAKQHGTAGLECEISHGRVTDAWVSKRLRAPKGVQAAEIPQPGPAPIPRYRVPSVRRLS